jgi:flavin-dependent dehydrogenase
MKVAVIGARLAGCYASLLLSAQGHEVLLFDHTTDREKPCGGGVTSKALRTMPWFMENPLPHNTIDTVRMTTLFGYSGKLKLRNPIHIFSRSTLDAALRAAAVAGGTRFIPERAVRFEHSGQGWAIHTRSGAHEVDYLVGADGATSSVRAALAGKYASEDLSLALGYYLPGEYHPNAVLAHFQEIGFFGYLWSFPRLDHSSVGILRWLPEANAAELRRRVLAFISARYPEAGEDKQFYAARIPCLSRRRLLEQRVCGPNWALLGDAAGFTDAITAEGIHYALRSAELLASVFRRGHPEEYESEWRSDFGGDLERAAAWRDRFYAGTFLFRTFIHRAVQVARLSPTAQLLTDALIAGRSTYMEMHRQLILRSPRILVEALCNTSFGSRFGGKELPLASER